MPSVKQPIIQQRNRLMNDNLARLEPEHTDKLQQIGSNLRELRQKHSLSIEEIAARTQIQARLIRAIEEGNIAVLPEPVYVRGMVRRYADLLGLNGSDLSNDIPNWKSSLAIVKKDDSTAWYEQLPAGGELKPIHLYLGYVFVIVAAVSGLSFALTNVQKSNAPTYVYESKKPEPLIPIIPIVASPTTSSTNNAKQIQIAVKVQSPTSVKVVVDGKTQFDGTVKPGEQHTWVANQQLILTTPNAGGLLVAQNNQTPQKFGAPGEKKQLKFQVSSNPKSQL